jgi:sporulation protein YlmC with PRC-barrel domain
MLGKFVLVTALSLLAAACVAPEPYDSSSTTRLDLDRGMWGTQPLTPPAGLATVRQSDLTGRKITQPNMAPLATIDWVLVDPASGQVRYAVAHRSDYSDYFLVPISAMQITPTTIMVDATDRQFTSLPRMSMAELNTRYPERALAAVAPLPPAAVIAPPAAAPAPPVEPLQLTRRGSVVGWPVVDAAGQPVGTVEAVSVVPATGEVRYAIISGPSMGLGYYIAIPASNIQAAGGRVVLTSAQPNWAQAPRYTGDQVQQIYGRLGTVS